MAVQTIATTVGTSAVVIIPAEAYAMPGSVGTVISNAGSNMVYLGPATVTASGATQGIPLEAGGRLPLGTLNSTLYAVTGTSTTTVVVGLLS